ncbi:uncharacterized protein LOC127847607 [Dreissena polymorpha]|uniref:uncharacterized protein LOC127847607 n=1 Tax=Dreissena polymorpha TaxID=45954 RepID=UPI0022642DFD|nr:uncharacterized protein LOC127847607 [Dreissena polymorpha]
MENIQQRAVSLITTSVSDSTRTAYNLAINHFNTFRLTYNLPDTWPIPLNQFIMYISYCFEKNYAPSTIKLYMSGISFVHKIRGFYNPFSNFVVSKMLEGCKRLRQQQDLRVPISLGMLNRLVSVLPNVCFSKFETKLFTAVFYLAYFGLFRISELVVCSNNTKDRALCKQDITFEGLNNAIIIRVRMSKTNQTGRPVFVRIPSNQETSICINAVKEYVAIAPARSEQFFCHANNTPMTRYQFSAVLSKACAQAGISSKVLSHSFRIGRATDLALQGYSDETIKRMGRWSSNCYSGYIRMKE